VFGDGDVVEVDEPRAGNVHRAVLATRPDVEKYEVGILEVFREPGRADEHLVALGERRTSGA